MKNWWLVFGGIQLVKMIQLLDQLNHVVIPEIDSVWISIFKESPGRVSRFVQEGVEAEAELEDSIEVEEMEGQAGPGVGWLDLLGALEHGFYFFHISIIIWVCLKMLG